MTKEEFSDLKERIEVIEVTLEAMISLLPDTKKEALIEEILALKQRWWETRMGESI